KKASAMLLYPTFEPVDGPVLIAGVRGGGIAGSYAIQFGILTAARSAEVLGATWKEIDFDTAMWTIPAERMKARTEHRVPLSKPAVAVLHRMELLRHKDGLIFPGHRDQGRRRLNHGSPMALLRR